MPPQSREQRKAALKRKRLASGKGEFNQMRFLFPERLNIVAEGDSWFAYPRNWILWGKQSNLIDHISSWAKGKANFYCMASNGDEAVDMVSGKQKHALVDVLRWHSEKSNRKLVDLLLFSGGGNDVVGENDFERFLQPYKSGNNAAQCVRQNRLKRKTKQIALAFEELLDIRDHYSPDTVVLTHTYDYPYPSDTGAILLGGLIKTKAWMKRFMDANGIPEELQADIIKIFMDYMGENLVKIAEKREKFIVVDSRGTLQGKKDWLNEIHPTSDGFKLIAEVIQKEMKAEFPVL